MLNQAGVPSTVVLDSAVAYVIDKVDMVLVGSEAVVESGGLINAVGSNQIAIIARAANKPFYALAERHVANCPSPFSSHSASSSYKFHRLFPLSQYDLPSHIPGLLSFSQPKLLRPSHRSSTTDVIDPDPVVQTKVSQEEIAQNNPDVDYTRWVIVAPYVAQ